LNNGVTNISRASLAKKDVGIAFRKAKQIPHHFSQIPGNAADLFHNDMIVMGKITANCAWPRFGRRRDRLCKPRTLTHCDEL
jgi:hypothetical protein